MKRFLAVGAVVAAAAAALFVGRADAILFGTPDGNAHKGVGYAVFYDATGAPLWRCTGSLVSTRVLLTAGHCAGRYDNSTGFHTPVLAQVWFDKQIQANGNYPGTGSCLGYRGWPCSGGDSYGVPVAHPDYVGSTADGTVNDIGVVVLVRPMKAKDVLPLAPVGTLETIAPRSAMTIVGYGTQTPTPPPVDQRQRMQGTIHFLRTEDGTQPDDDPAFADFTNFQAAGSAACHGDSGGPVLDADGEIVAVMALVAGDLDGYCQGLAYHYRTDTADSQQFLARFGVRVGGNGGDDGHHGHRGKHGHDLRDLLDLFRR
jgi:hypothetical protein